MSLKHKKTNRHLDDIVAFTEKVDKSDRAASKERSKCIAAEKQMTEVGTTIKFLRSQLQEVNS